MSLIFLKSRDDTENEVHDPNLPYRWKNYFDMPLKIPPNAQVALVNGLLHEDNWGDVEGDDPIYCNIGASCLNMVYPVYYENNLNSWTDWLNQLGCAISSYQPNSNYDYTDRTENVVYGNLSQNLTPNRGCVWYKNNQSKSDIRFTQHNVVFDTFQQYFNALNTNRNVTYSNGQQIGDFLQMDGTNQARSIKYKNSYVDRASLPLGIDYPYATQINFATGWGTQSGSGNYNFNNTSNFYNTGWANNRASESWANIAGSMSQPAPAGANLDLLREEYVFAMLCTRSQIMRCVGTMTPSNDPAINKEFDGHQAIGSQGSGGYILHMHEPLDQALANRVYDLPYVGSANMVGFTGMLPCYFGAMPEEVLYGNDRTSAVESLKNHLENVDINVIVDYDDKMRAQSGRCRYVFGARVYPEGSTLRLQAEVLKADQTNSSCLDFSEYVEIGNALDLGRLAQGINTCTGGAGTNFAPAWAGAPKKIGTRNGPNTILIHFRFRWTSPYCLCLEFMLTDPATATSYSVVTDEPFAPAPANPQVGNPLTGWCMIANMKGDGGTTQDDYLIPTYFGGLNMVQYVAYGQTPAGPIPNGEGQGVAWKGYFFPKKGYNLGVPNVYGPNTSGLPNYPEYPENKTLSATNFNYPELRDKVWFQENVNNQGIGHFWDQSIRQKGNYTSPEIALYELEDVGWQPEEFDAQGRMKMPILMLVETPNEDTEGLELLQDINGIQMFDGVGPDFPFTEVGTQTGIIDLNSLSELLELNIDIDATGTDFEVYGVNGKHTLISTQRATNYHIQLLNLPIQSVNGCTSSMNKTIYVCSLVEGYKNQDTGYYTSFEVNPRELVWIDLNNYNPMELNDLNVLISDDDGIEADSLDRNTNLCVAFRAKPLRDEGYLPDNIPVVNKN